MKGPPQAISERFLGRVGPRIGHGGQATVYELDADKVLRVYWGAYDGLDRLADYYASMNRGAVSFAVPEIIEYGEIDGRGYTVDRRLPGRPLIDVLPELRGTDRRLVLDSYVDAAHQITVLAPHSQPSSVNWKQFLRAETEQRASALRTHFEADVPDWDAMLTALYRRIDALEEPKAPGLVHGDYFPGNVLAGDDLTVSAVLDFDLMSNAGDPLMDITGAAFFLEVQRKFDPADASYVFGRLEERHGPGIHDVAETYRRWYAVHFAHSKGVDDRLYAWCLHTLSNSA